MELQGARKAGDESGIPVVVVTGLSGSGKSTALAVFEDMGFFTVDGLPAIFAPKLAEMVLGNNFQYQGLALGMDLRQGDLERELHSALSSLRQAGFFPRVIFLEAGRDVLLKRYATTRRPHPLEREGLGLDQAVQKERTLMRHLRKMADLVIDTSSHSIHDLRRTLQEKWRSLRNLAKSLRIHIISFGFKYGAPAEADMIFDLRFLPNPYFDPVLKPLCGLDPPVASYVLEHEPGREFFHRLTDFMRFILEKTEEEGRYRTTIGIGCTGGRHRSVAVAEALARYLRGMDYGLSVEHRHMALDEAGR